MGSIHLANVSATRETSQCVPCASLGFDCLPCTFVQDNATVANFMMDHPNATQNSLFFIGPYLEKYMRTSTADIANHLILTVSTAELGLVFDLNDSYILYYNFTMGQYPFFEIDHTMQLKRALDEATLRRSLAGSGPAPPVCGSDVTGRREAGAVNSSCVQMDVDWSHFPTPVPRIHGFDVVAADGGIWFYVPPMITFFIVLTEVRILTVVNMPCPPTHIRPLSDVPH